MTWLDHHGLPTRLHDWFYPTDGTTRDWVSLQVVFGRGEEYFASDRHGKIEHKDPDARKAVEDGEKTDRGVLRRSRPASFLRRRLSETSVRPDSTAISSQRPSRPSSLVCSRTKLHVSMLSQSNSRPSSTTSSANPWAAPYSPSWHLAPGHHSAQTAYGLSDESMDESMIRTGKSPARHNSFHPEFQDEVRDIFASPVHMSSSSTTTTPQEARYPPPSQTLLPLKILYSPTKETPPCTCRCYAHAPQTPSPTYTDSSAQTEPTSTPCTAQPRPHCLNTSTHPSTCKAQKRRTLAALDTSGSATQLSPLAMGGLMHNYFGNPGYQLGDSLLRGQQNVPM